MTSISLDFLTVDSWNSSHDPLLLAYRNYTSKKTPCSKWRMGLNALIHIVKAVAYAIFLPFAFLYSTFSSKDMGLWTWRQMTLNADMAELSFLAMRNCKSAMEQLRVLEVRSHCHTLLFPHDLRFTSLVSIESKQNKFEEELIKRLKSLNDHDLNVALAILFDSYSINCLEKFLELLLRFQIENPQNQVVNRKILEIQKLIYTRTLTIVLKQGNSTLYCHLPTYKQKLELFCPDLKPKIAQLIKKEGEGMIEITSQQKYIFDMIKKM